MFQSLKIQKFALKSIRKSKVRKFLKTKKLKAHKDKKKDYKGVQIRILPVGIGLIMK